MFVAASSRCFPDVAQETCIDKLADLEYTAYEVVIGNRKSDLNPDILLGSLEQAAKLCCSNRQIRPISFFLDLEGTDPHYFEVFDACCRLSKFLRIVSITVKSGILGTPYNEEIERLRRLTKAAMFDGITVGILNESGKIAGTAESIQSLCKSVSHLALTLDPSYFIFNQPNPVDYDSLIPLTSHVRLRDTTREKFQVLLGQGILEYGKLVIQLSKVKYNRALCVDLHPLPDVNQETELRKMRLLLESIL
ncbi:MAG: sugar phosphate isomerase/epimerase [Planctomycetia bacterium]|nr:sugar phosphate isomerase/epimerase [Planctomycetia bacterium]